MNRTRNFVPSLEPLENRITPAVTLPESGSVSAITIQGDDAADSVAILHEQGRLTVTAGDQTRVYTATDFTVSLRLRGGNDTVSYRVGGDLVGGSLSLVGRLGSGGDTFAASQVEDANISGASIGLTVLGGRGGDTVNVNLGGQVSLTDSGDFRVEAVLGSGRDVFNADLGLGSDLSLGVGSGSQLHITARGGRGADTIGVDGNFGGDTSVVQGSALFNLRGGVGRDSLSAAFSGEFAADLAGGGFTVLADGGGSSDLVTVEMDVSVTALPVEKLVDSGLVDLNGLLASVTDTHSLTELLDADLIDVEGLLDTLGLDSDDLLGLNVGDLVDLGLIDLGPVQGLIDLGVLDLDVIRGMELGVFLDLEVEVLGVQTPVDALLDIDLELLGLDIIATVSLADLEARGILDLNLGAFGPDSVLGDHNLLELTDLGLVSLDELSALLADLLNSSLLDLEDLGLLDLGLLDLDGRPPESLGLLDLGMTDLEQLGLLDLGDPVTLRLIGLGEASGGWSVAVGGGRGRDNLTLDLTGVPDPDLLTFALLDGGAGIDWGVVMGDPAVTAKVRVRSVETP